MTRSLCNHNLSADALRLLNRWILVQTGYKNKLILLPQCNQDLKGLSKIVDKFFHSDNLAPCQILITINFM